MYYSDLMKPRVYNYTELNKLNHLPRGSIVIVMNPVEHKWIKMRDGWYNTNPELLNGKYKIDFNEKPINIKFKQFINKVKSIFK